MRALDQGQRFKHTFCIQRLQFSQQHICPTLHVGPTNESIYSGYLKFTGSTVYVKTVSTILPSGKFGSSPPTPPSRPEKLVTPLLLIS